MAAGAHLLESYSKRGGTVQQMGSSGFLSTMVTLTLLTTRCQYFSAMDLTPPRSYLRVDWVSDNSWDAKDPRKALLTCEEVSHLAASGIEIGSHGLRHSSLPSLSRTALVSEITDSRRILQEVSGQDVLGFCYPYGHLDERAVTAAQAAGYDYACAVWATEFAGRYALRRYNMLDRYSRAHLWYMGWRYWLRWEYQGPGSGTLAAAHAWRERRRLVRKSGQTLDS